MTDISEKTSEKTEQIYEVIPDYLKPDPNPLIELPNEAEQPEKEYQLPENEPTKEEPEQEELNQPEIESPTPKIYYDPIGVAFYHSDFFAPEQIPPNAIEISAEQHNELLQAINSGCVVFDDLSVSKPKPTAYHQMDYESRQWRLPEAAVVQQLATVKAAKLKEAAREAQNIINSTSGLDILPEFEVQTWTIQAQEAEAWAADNTVATPVLSQIAAARGVDVNALRAAALKKARLYTAITAHIAGQRQAFEDAIMTAKTVGQVEAIPMILTLPAV